MKTDQYLEQLRSLTNPDPFLLQRSGLPGPRGNLELAQVAAALPETGKPLIEPWLTSADPDYALDYAQSPPATRGCRLGADMARQTMKEASKR
ncbi:MAG: hypothetical protein LLG44_07970 [Chloroflexi bacterium]|nr:hypothetical protein [Chloroflexota bacterium]